MERGSEVDIGEEVLSSAWDPRFGDKAGISERLRLAMKEIDNGIEGLRWEIRFGVRHRGFG